MAEIKPNSCAGLNELITRVVSDSKKKTPAYYDFIANAVQLGHGHRLLKTYPMMSIKSQTSKPTMSAPSAIKAGSMVAMDVKQFLNAIQCYGITDAADILVLNMASTGSVRVVFKKDVGVSNDQEVNAADS